MTAEILRPYYFRVTDLWKRLCEEHNELLDLTHEEYAHLLSGKIEELEQVIEKKIDIVEHINNLENVRQTIIDSLNKALGPQDKEVQTVTELIVLMQKFEAISNEKHLFRFNELLIDIIEKIQDQNRKNQLFLNKAIKSVTDIREEISGKKTYSVYGPQGTKMEKEA